jgi:hypothetical protein
MLMSLRWRLHRVRYWKRRQTTKLFQRDLRGRKKVTQKTATQSATTMK